MTSETEGPAPEAPLEGLEETAPKARFAHTLTPANETDPPPPPEPANSDVEGEADAAPPSTQEWPLAWLRLVEPEPPEADDEVVAAVIAAEPADADGVAHAFSRVMAAAVDPEPLADAEPASESPVRAYYSIPVIEPLDAPAAEDDQGLVLAAAPAVAAKVEETAVAEPEEPRFESPVYAARRSLARKAAAEAEAPTEGQGGESAPALAAYIFYLAGFLLIPALAGVAIAYNARRTAPAWLQSHYLFLIRTFWIGLAGMAVGAALLFSGRLTLGGLLLGLLMIVWLEMRSAIGFINVVKRRAFPRPRSWMF